MTAQFSISLFRFVAPRRAALALFGILFTCTTSDTPGIIQNFANLVNNIVPRGTAWRFITEGQFSCPPFLLLAWCCSLCIFLYFSISVSLPVASCHVRQSRVNECTSLHCTQCTTPVCVCGVCIYFMKSGKAPAVIIKCATQTKNKFVLNLVYIFRFCGNEWKYTKNIYEEEEELFWNSTRITYHKLRIIIIFNLVLFWLFSNTPMLLLLFSVFCFLFWYCLYFSDFNFSCCDHRLFVRGIASFTTHNVYEMYVCVLCNM